MKLKLTIIALSIISSGALYAVTQTSDPHSTCSVLHGFEPGTKEYDECVEKVKANNAQAQNNTQSNYNTQKNVGQNNNNKKSCCGR
ncbi:MAG: hypothetical protein WD055_03640 [Candidatus Dependentiae bacterium]